MQEACSRCGKASEVGPLGFCDPCWIEEAIIVRCVRCGRAPPEQSYSLCRRCRAKADGIAEGIVEHAGPATELRLRRRADEVAVRFYRDKLALVLARMRREVRDSRRLACSPVLGVDTEERIAARVWANAAALVRFADRRGIHPTLRTMLRDRDAALGSEAR